MKGTRPNSLDDHPIAVRGVVMSERARISEKQLDEIIDATRGSDDLREAVRRELRRMGLIAA